MRTLTRRFLASVLAASALTGAASCKPSGPEERPGMAYIPAGEFPMGSRPDDALVYDFERPHEQPQRQVYVDAFYMDVHEVTNAEYEKVDPNHQRAEQSSCDDCPATKVAWFEAGEYCKKQGKRLPTEAEWEKAAKGGVDERPKQLDEVAWYARNSIQNTRPVMQKKPNGYGLYDVLGNAREWTTDWYDPGYYAKNDVKNPKGPAEGARRVERGGAFFLPERGVTSTIRYNHPPTFRLYFLGFRCVQDP